MNILQLVQMIKGGSNPKQLAMNMLQNISGNNPIANNVFQMAQQGNAAGIEQIARNVCKEKGVDFDTAFNNFRNNLGL